MFVRDERGFKDTLLFENSCTVVHRTPGCPTWSGLRRPRSPEDYVLLTLSPLPHTRSSFFPCPYPCLRVRPVSGDGGRVGVRTDTCRRRRAYWVRDDASVPRDFSVPTIESNTKEFLSVTRFPTSRFECPTPA